MEHDSLARTRFLLTEYMRAVRRFGKASNDLVHEVSLCPPQDLFACLVDMVNSGDMSILEGISEYEVGSAVSSSVISIGIGDGTPRVVLHFGVRHGSRY